MADNIHSDDAEQKNGFHQALKKGCYPVAAGVGAVYGHRNVRNALYDFLKKRGAFKDEIDALDEGVGGLIADAESTLKAGGKADLRGKIRPKSVTFANDVTGALKKLGYTSTLDYFRELPAAQQWEAAGIAISAGSVALGVALTIAENRAIVDRLTNHKDKAAAIQR